MEKTGSPLGSLDHEGTGTRDRRGRSSLGYGVLTTISSVSLSLWATSTCPASRAPQPAITPGRGSQPAGAGGFYSRPDSGSMWCQELSTCSATPAGLQALPDPSRPQLPSWSNCWSGLVPLDVLYSQGCGGGSLCLWGSPCTMQRSVWHSTG